MARSDPNGTVIVPTPIKSH